MDERPTVRHIDHVALFKEINEFVSIHELLEPLSPYSSDSDSGSSHDCLTDHAFSPSHRLRAKSKYKRARTSYGKLEDPSQCKLFQMLAEGARRKARDPSLIHPCAATTLEKPGNFRYRTNRPCERSYFNSHARSLSKYPSYCDFVDAIKKPFKSIEVKPDRDSQQDPMENVENNLNCSPISSTSDLDPQILSALNQMFFTSD